jgi:quinoprotein glucose dehydrogenase
MKRTSFASLVTVLTTVALFGQSSQSDWKFFGNDPGHQRFSTLTQITPENVSRLTRAWTYDTGIVAGWDGTPIVVDNVMYTSLPASSGVAAVDPESGKEIWRYRAQARGRVLRGVTYWPGDARDVARIIYAAGQYLVALDAKTGKPVESFGDRGIVDAHPGMPDAIALADSVRAAAIASGRGAGTNSAGGRGAADGDGAGRGSASATPNAVPVFVNGPVNGLFSFSSPPALYKDLLIFGGSLGEEAIVGPPGNARAIDIRTGRLVWTFNGIPQPGERNFGTWGDGWKNRGGPSLWGPISVDVDRGIAFLPFGNPGGSFYGADRPGDNLYSESVVAVDAATGRYRWHFQATRHDVWDFDLSAPPQLIEVVQNGRRIPAVAQISKNGFLFILDRLTGKPIYPVEERSVPASAVPGEVLAKTQPFPTGPAPWVRMTMTREDITTVTPESNKFCTELWDSEKIFSAGPYTSFQENRSTVVFAGTGGGGNWGGGAFNPLLGYYFVNTTNSPTMTRMVKGPDGVYRNVLGYRRFSDMNGNPCVQPPWGELVAVNVNTGKVAWKIPLGNDETGAKAGALDTGQVTRGGPTATASGLVFISATRNPVLRAFDGRTGKELWSTDIGRGATANPMTFMGRNGRQYVVTVGAAPGTVLADGRSTTTAHILAYALPQ